MTTEKRYVAALSMRTMQRVQPTHLDDREEHVSKRIGRRSARQSSGYGHNRSLIVDWRSKITRTLSGLSGVAPTFNLPLT